MEKRDQSIDRRQFICKSAMLCALMPVMGAAGLPTEKRESGQKEMTMNTAELTSYCGLYCGACDIYQKRIGNTGKELQSVLTAFKFDQYAHMIPGLEEYESFEKVLGNMIQMFGQCAACRGGGGDPACKIRLCAKEKGVESCALCPEVPCENFKAFMEFNPHIKDELARIKEMGLEGWSQHMQKKVDKGFRNSDTLTK